MRYQIYDDFLIANNVNGKASDRTARQILREIIDVRKRIEELNKSEQRIISEIQRKVNQKKK